MRSPRVGIASSPRQRAGTNNDILTRLGDLVPGVLVILGKTGPGLAVHFHTPYEGNVGFKTWNIIIR